MADPGSGVAWLTAFLDLRAGTFEASAGFWTAATGTTLSPRRGTGGRFATLLPADGDPCWRVQQLESGGPGIHLDLHAAHPPALRSAVEARGADVVRVYDDLTVLRSPGGFPFCVVEDVGGGSPRRAGEASLERPGPVDWGGHVSMLDQVCLDVPEAALETEIAFWAGVLAADPSPSTRRDEFTNLRRPDHLPLRVLFQRVGHTGAVTAHPDLATTDREAEVGRLRALGAETVTIEQFWTVLRAPDDRLFCVTERDPHTGQLN